MTARILLVDDDPGVTRAVAGLLADEGYATQGVASAAEARAALAAGDVPALVLLDLRMPGEGGLALLQSLPRPWPAPVVVLSGEASPAEAVAALKLGALDFVEKPPTPERLLTAVKNALALHALREERARLQEELARPGHLVGESAAMASLREWVARLGPRPTAVLITGETGCGKERVARALHHASGRTGRFVAVNCAAIPLGLLESELFGHEEGAFSGATQRRPGRFEQADGGTLLLDELGDMPPDLQAKLLRVLETREVERLGGTRPVKVDVRVLAATHRDLRKEVQAGRFREDLYFRLAVAPLCVPPLRERPEDLLPLMRVFALELGGARAELRVAPCAEAALRAYRWPGNARELRNFVERLVLLSGDGPGGEVTADAVRALTSSLPLAGTRAPGVGPRPYREQVEDFERALVTAAVQQEGSIAAAARLLQVDRGNLYRRLKALGLAESLGRGEPGAED